MRRIYLMICCALGVMAISISSCRKIEDSLILGNTEDGFVSGDYKNGVLNATDQDNWHYYSIIEDEFVLVGKSDDYDVTDSDWTEDPLGNPLPDIKKHTYYPHTDIKERMDWDFAICRREVRTNSGTSGVGNGGLYTFDDGTDYNSIISLPSEVVFVEDAITESPSMSNIEVWKSISTAVVTDMNGMPPTYLQPPIYAIRSADGESIYALDFIRYQNAMGVTGYVSFQLKKIIQ